MKPIISIKNLKKTFDNKTYVLKDVNLDIEENKITSIIGFSGTGKSVLIKHILGLLVPTSGSIEVLGEKLQDVSKEKMIAIRHFFGMLFQNSALFDSMSTLENVCFPLKEHRLSLSQKEIVKQAQHKLGQVGISAEHYNKLPASLSGGMKKRVALARALALNPKILIYDEPTTGLDPVLTEIVDELILKTHKDTHCTTIIVSHDLYSAFRFSDNITMLNEGRVLLSGTPEEFYKTDLSLVRKFLEKGLKIE